MPATSDPPTLSETRCAGCGGRNVPAALECDWCGRPFASPRKRLQLASWQILSTALFLAVLAAFVALAALNANRVLPPPRPPAAVAPLSSPVPTPAVTPRVLSASTPTLRPASTPPPALAPLPPPTPVPTPRAVMQVGGTGGQGVTLRAEAGPQATALAMLREGSRVTPTGVEQTIAARIWREVEVEATGLRGWVAADFLVAP